MTAYIRIKNRQSARSMSSRNFLLQCSEIQRSQKQLQKYTTKYRTRLIWFLCISYQFTGLC